MTSPRPTPLTDAAIRWSSGKQKYVAADFARQLERDRAELMEALKELLADCDADLKPTKKHPARALLARLTEQGK